MWKLLTRTFHIVLALGWLTFAGAAIAIHFGAGRLIASGSGLGAALFAGLYLIGAAIWGSPAPWWMGKSRASHGLPSSVTQAMLPPGPEYYERPPPQGKPPQDLTPSPPASPPPPTSTQAPPPPDSRADARATTCRG